MSKITILILSVVFVVSSLAEAKEGIVFSPSIGLNTFIVNKQYDEIATDALPIQEVDRVNNTKESQTFFDIGVGYLTASGLYVGLKYLSLSVVSEGSFIDFDVDTDDKITLESTGQRDTTFVGASVGWFGDNWRMSLSYLPTINDSAKVEVTQKLELSSGTTEAEEVTEYTYSGGSAYSLDIGYTFNYGMFSFGPKLTYLKYSYKEVEEDYTLTSETSSIPSSVTKSSGSFEMQRLFPMIETSFQF